MAAATSSTTQPSVRQPAIELRALTHVRKSQRSHSIIDSTLSRVRRSSYAPFIHFWAGYEWPSGRYPCSPPFPVRSHAKSVPGRAEARSSASPRQPWVSLGFFPWRELNPDRLAPVEICERVPVSQRLQ